MPERSTVIGDSLVTNPVSERIEDGYIHIYPSLKMSIKMARNFTDELSDLGYKPVERTDDRSVAVDVPVNIMIMFDDMMISFYRHDFGEKMDSRLHNFVIEPIDEYIEEELRRRTDVVSRVKYIPPSLVFGELPQVIHMTFDLKTLEKVGRKEEKLDDWFG